MLIKARLELLMVSSRKTSKVAARHHPSAFAKHEIQLGSPTVFGLKPIRAKRYHTKTKSSTHRNLFLNGLNFNSQAEKLERQLRRDLYSSMATPNNASYGHSILQSVNEHTTGPAHSLNADPRRLLVYA